MVHNKMTSIFIIVGLLVLVFAVTFFFKKPSTTNVATKVVSEYRDFSCSGWEDVTFRYPVFKSLPSVRVEPDVVDAKNTCRILIGADEKLSLVMITLQKGDLSTMTSADYKKTFTTTTKNGIPYSLEAQSSTSDNSAFSKLMKLVLFTDDTNANAPYGITMKSAYPIKSGQVEGFDENVFFQEIIDSFLVIKK